MRNEVVAVKLIIKGANLDGDQVGRVIDNLQDEFGAYGLRIRNMTCYVNFIDSVSLDAVEIEDKGRAIERTVIFDANGEIYHEESRFAEENPG